MLDGRRQARRQQGQADKDQENQYTQGHHPFDEDRGHRKGHVGGGPCQAIDPQKVDAHAARHECPDKTAHKHQSDNATEADRRGEPVQQKIQTVGRHQPDYHIDGQERRQELGSGLGEGSERLAKVDPAQGGVADQGLVAAGQIGYHGGRVKVTRPRVAIGPRPKWSAQPQSSRRGRQGRAAEPETESDDRCS